MTHDPQSPREAGEVRPAVEDAITSAFWASLKRVGANSREIQTLYALLIGAHAGDGGDYWRPINEAIREEFGLRDFRRFDKWKKGAWAAQPANELGQVSFARAMLESAEDALAWALEARASVPPEAPAASPRDGDGERPQGAGWPEPPKFPASHPERLSADDLRLTGTALSEWAWDHLSKGYGVCLSVREVSRLIAEVRAEALATGGAPASVPAGSDPWQWLSDHPGAELSYGESEDEGEASWQVHLITGGVNDREWTFVGSGATPLGAVLAAIAAAPTPEEGEDR